MLSYSSGPAKHILETNSSSDEGYLIKVNKLTKTLSLEKILVLFVSGRAVTETHLFAELQQPRKVSGLGGHFFVTSL